MYSDKDMLQFQFNNNITDVMNIGDVVENNDPESDDVFPEYLEDIFENKENEIDTHFDIDAIIKDRYKDIIDDGEVSFDTLKNVLMKTGGFLPNELQIKSGNCSSFVFVSNDMNIVYQYFTGKSTAKKIFFLISKIYRMPIVNGNIKNEKKVILFNFMCYYPI